MPLTLESQSPVHIVQGNNVEVSGEMQPTTEPKTYLEKILQGPIESCSGYTGKVLDLWDGSNCLGIAANIAYDNHYPLFLSPDIIWLTLTQGLARHINENSEALRKHFVQHEGKETLEVRIDDFCKGSPENPWETVFPQFSAKIKEHIGEETHKLIVADYSTTDVKARAASEIVLMDAMQAYFEYLCSTLCGIPHFEIAGTVEDWERMHERVGEWAKWDLDWWTPHAQHVIANFVLAAKGEGDAGWFQNFFKLGGGSGGPYINGWINWLFPYLYNSYDKGYFKNKTLGELGSDFFGGTKIDQLPASYSKVPFTWLYYEQEFDCQFIGGLLGVEQREDSTLKPRIGWVMMEVPEVKEQKKQEW